MAKPFRVLAWDTSSKAGSVALVEFAESGTKVLSELSIDLSARHSERLLWSIHQALDSVGIDLKEIDLIGVGLGPGSFTGLRVGVTTAKTLAWILGKPVAGVSSLAALARPVAALVSQLESRSIVVATVDAAKAQLYALVGSAKSILDCACWSDGDYAGLWKRGVIEGVFGQTDLPKLIQKKMKEGNPAQHWIAVGGGRELYPDVWRRVGLKKEMQPPLAFSHRVLGSSIALLSWEAFQAGALRDPRVLKPRYIRASEAEEKLNLRILGQVS